MPDNWQDKRTMTLNLRPNEMEVVERMAADADLSKTAIIRQALRLYQLVHERLKAGETMGFSGDRERTVLFVGLGLPSPPTDKEPVG